MAADPDMALPPRRLGGRGEHAVHLEFRGGAFTALVDGRPLPSVFASEGAARLAAAAQVLRLDATELALLGRIRRGRLRKL